MRPIRIAALVLLLFTGCFEFETVVKVNPDGSGTVYQTVLMSRHMVRQIRDMAESMEASSGQKGKGFDVLDQEKLFLQAKSMGRGVRYASATRLFTRDKDGYTATYRFDDINTLSINQNPKETTSHLPAGDEGEAPSEPITFSFFRGTPGTLVIRFPQEMQKQHSWEERERSRGNDPTDTTGLAAMTELFRGFRMAISVLVNGTIVGTNAAHVDSNQITLMAVDFEQLMKNKAEFAALSRTNPTTVEEAKNLLKNITGIRMELAREVMVQFQ